MEGIRAWLVWHIWPLHIESNLMYPQRTAQVRQSSLPVVITDRFYVPIFQALRSCLQQILLFPFTDDLSLHVESRVEHNLPTNLVNSKFRDLVTISSVIS